MSFAETTPFVKNYRPGFVGDYLSREHLLPGGIKVDASTFVAADAVSVILGSAGAAAGATSIPVDALAFPAGVSKIPSGTELNFGARAAVVVTLSANAAADATSITFAALTGPIPSGTVLDFGTNKFARTTAAAATGATTVAVAALPKALTSGDAATYAAVANRVAVTTADADTGDTSIAVAALDEPLVDDDVAYYNAPAIVDGKVVLQKRVAAGSLVGLTNSELEGASANGVEWGKAGDGDDVVRILAFDIQDVTTDNDGDVLRPGTLIRVNNLPNWSTLSSALKAKIRSTYEVTVGTPGQEVAAA